jgi:hypothetical protein
MILVKIRRAEFIDLLISRRDKLHTNHEAYMVGVKSSYSENRIRRINDAYEKGLEPYNTKINQLKSLNSEYIQVSLDEL